MATEYLARNADSLADGNWKLANGSAGAGIASGDNVYHIPDGSVPIVSTLDHSGLAEGVEGFVIGAERRGDIGTAGTPLEIDVDFSSDATFTNLAASGTLYYKPSGDDNLCQIFKHGGRGSRTSLLGGTVTKLVQEQGIVEANESTVVTTFDNYGGGAVLEYNATATTLNIYGAPRRIITIKRAATINFYGSGTLLIDIEQTNAPTMTLNMFNDHARVVVLRCDTLATVNHRAGMVDLTQARRALAYGSSAHTRGPRSILKSDTRHTITAAVFEGVGQEIGAPSGAGL